MIFLILLPVQLLHTAVLTNLPCVLKAKNALKMTDIGHYLDVSGVPPRKVRKHFHQRTRAGQFYLNCVTVMHLFSPNLSFTSTMCSQGKACFRGHRCEWSVLAVHAPQTHPLILQSALSWRWVEVCFFLNHILDEGRQSVVSG